MKKILISLLLLLPALLQAQTPMSVSAMKAVITQKITPSGTAKITAQATREAMNTLAEQIDLANQALAAANVRFDQFAASTTGVTTNWSVTSLQAAMDAGALATKGVIVVNNKVVITTTSLQLRSNVELRSTNGKGWLCGTVNQPALEGHGVVYNAQFTGLAITNALVASAEQTHAGCFQSYEDFEAAGVKFSKCFFSVPRANMNAISIAPYSPVAYGGNGRGNIFSGFVLEDCIADSVGRGFCEITNLTQEDDQDVELFQNSTVRRVRVTNCGYLSTTNPKWGAAFSWSGPSRYALFEDIYVENAWFAGVEIVAGRNVVMRNVTSATSNSSVFATISLSATFKNSYRCKNILIENCGGTALGRFIAAYDTDSLTIRGSVATTGKRNAFDRVTKLSIENVFWSVNRGTGDVDGAQVVHIKDSGISVKRSRFYETSTSEQNYAVFETEGSTTGSISDVILFRPSVNQNDVMFKIQNTPGVTQSNVKQNNIR